MIDTTVAIPTIGRVEMLPAVLYAIANQESKYGRVAELVLLDEADGPVTQHYAVNQMLDLMSVHGVDIRIIRNRRRKGIGAARIRMAEEATNARVLMVDDDVCLRPNVLDDLTIALEREHKIAQWAVPSCFLVNKGLDLGYAELDGYSDQYVSRDDPKVKEWTERYPWFVPYYMYDEPFDQLIPCAGTQAILLRDKYQFIQATHEMVKLGSLPREDTYMTRKYGPGVFTSRAVCDHFEHADQRNRGHWGSSQFYRLHQVAMEHPDAFLELFGSGTLILEATSPEEPVTQTKASVA